MNIQQIKEKTFDTSMRGYRPEEVHSYLNEICSYIKELQEEKADLLKKMEVLAVKIEEYRKDEESIREALLGAQKLGKSVLSEAKEKADRLSKESEEKSQKMLADAKEESEKLLSEAKTTARNLLTKAKTESSKMEEETKQNVEHIIRSTKYQIDKEQTNLIRMQKEVSIFKSELLELYRAHIDLIKKLPEIDEDKSEQVKDLNKKIYEQKAEEKKAVEMAEDSAKEIKQEEAPKQEASEQAAEQTVAQMKSQETKEYDKEEIKETVNPQFKAVPEEKAEKPIYIPVEEYKKEQAQQAKKEKTAETPREHYVKKFGELQFGGKSNHK